MLPANRCGTVYGARKIFSPPIRSSGIPSFQVALTGRPVAHVHGCVAVVVADDLPLESQADQRRRFHDELSRLRSVIARVDPAIRRGKPKLFMLLFLQSSVGCTALSGASPPSPAFGIGDTRVRFRAPRTQNPATLKARRSGLLDNTVVSIGGVSGAER